MAIFTRLRLKVEKSMTVNTKNTLNKYNRYFSINQSHITLLITQTKNTLKSNTVTNEIIAKART